MNEKILQFTPVAFLDIEKLFSMMLSRLFSTFQIIQEIFFILKIWLFRRILKIFHFENLVFQEPLGFGLI